VSPTPDADERALATALAGLAPPAVRTGVRRIDSSHVSDLRDVERQVMQTAVPKRVREFATGRALLRELMESDEAIPVAADRTPLVPSGFRVSLAHDDRYAIAAVSCDEQVESLGIDIEPSASLEPPIGRIILRPDDAQIDARLAFTLKEAAFKAWSGSGGRMLEHHDVRLTAAESTFEAEVMPDGVRIRGRFTEAVERWLALTVVLTGARDEA
jgi:4'-phosphopantetheinyl transferase EntD